jgi:hypothetical protein
MNKPVYSFHDLVGLIGFKITALKADELALNGNLFLENQDGEEKEVFIKFGSINGDAISIYEKEVNCVSLTMRDAKQDDLVPLYGKVLYVMNDVCDQENNVIAKSFTYRSNEESEELSKFITVHIYNNGEIKISDWY